MIARTPLLCGLATLANGKGTGAWRCFITTIWEKASSASLLPKVRLVESAAANERDHADKVEWASSFDALAEVREWAQAMLAASGKPFPVVDWQELASRSEWKPGKPA